MKVLLVHNYLYQRGGEDVMFDSLYELLTSKGIDTKLFTRKSSSIKELKSKIDTIKRLSIPNLSSHDFNQLNKWTPDLIYISNIFPLIGLNIYRYANSRNIPIIQSYHSYRYLCPKSTLLRNDDLCELCTNRIFPYHSIIYKCYHQSRISSVFLSYHLFLLHKSKLINTVKKHIFPAKFTKNYFISKINLPNHKCIVIPNFIFDPLIRYPALNKIKKDQYFIYLGRLSEEKGILSLINVFKNFKNSKLFILGKGPLEKKIEKNKYSNIKILGYMPKKNLFQFLSKAIALIIPSKGIYEFGPLNLIESLSCKTPVITPKSGVFPERVKHGYSGLLYNPDDNQDFITQIKKMLKIFNSRKYENISNNARQEYLSKYTPEIYYNHIFSEFLSVLNK